MALLTFYIYDLNLNKTRVENLLSFEFSKDIDAACDGLRLSFLSKKTLDEISRVEMYEGEKKIFRGFCDVQKESVGDGGYTVFLYARSSACLLVDSEARPAVYYSPSAMSLFYDNAKEFGFVSKLPALSCKYDYRVDKGTSCFGAINNFVYTLCGKSITVSPENEIMLLQSDGKVKLGKYDIISEKRTINRATPICRIDYKISGDSNYVHHMKSRALEKKGVIRSRKLNISALPQWQREYTIKNRMNAACSDYIIFELVLDGCHNFSLFDSAEYESAHFGSIENCFISSVCISGDGSGELTRIKINQKIDLEEINYVAE